MRRVPSELILAIIAFALSAAADTHIDAPMPPYCNPRGNWAECAPVGAPASEDEFSLEELNDFSDFDEFVRKETDREIGVAGGYAKLTLRWTKYGTNPIAFLEVVSYRSLSGRAANRLAKRYHRTLNREGVLSVGIERYAWPWQRQPEADWCELSRQTENEDWMVECGAE